MNESNVIDMPKKEYKYFISFHFKGSSDHGFGNSEACVSRRIKGMDDISVLSSSMGKDMDATVVILNYKELEG